MKKSPLNFSIPGFAASIASGIAGNRPKSIQEIMMNAASVSSAIKKHEGAMHQDEAKPQTIGSTSVEGIQSVQNNLINPPSAEMTGNIQPGVYNQTGFSQGTMGTADQVFNTPEERNKII